jgi:hypothetical protein
VRIPAKINDTLDEFGRIGNPGHDFVAANFLCVLNIDSIFFIAQGEGEKFG